MVSQRLQLLFSTAILAAALTGCTQELTLEGSKENLAKEKPETEQEIIFPDFNPSIADGKVVWNKLQCAECHGESGTGVVGKATNDMTDPTRSASGKSPKFQYRTLAYGLPLWDHPKLKDKITNRELWDLVFYVRSLESPPLTDKELAQLEPIFGANCSACHGLRGFGDGDLANNINPMPANFHQYNRFFDRDDPMLHIHIAEGLYPSAMPDFLHKEDRTNNVVFDDALISKLVRYVRHFSVGYKPTYLGPIENKNGKASAPTKRTNDDT